MATLEKKMERQKWQQTNGIEEQMEILELKYKITGRV